MSGKRFVALDRDGTIIKEAEYLSDPEKVELFANTAAGMKKMAELGFELVIITNQSGIGRKYYTENDYQSVSKRVVELLQNDGVKLAGIYHCPHTPDDECECRKPKTAMIEKAVKDLGLDPKNFIMIGDKPADIEVGINAGARTTILVRTGYGAEHENKETCSPDFVADDLLEAALYIEKNCL